MKKTINITELAKYIGVSQKTMYNMVNSNRFPVLPIPETKPRRWNTEEVEKWLNS